MNKKEYEKPRIEAVKVELDSILATTSPSAEIPIAKPGDGSEQPEPGEGGDIWGD